METPGAFLGPWRLMSIDGMEWDVPDTPANAAFFGFPGTGKDGAAGAFPKARVVTVGECGSHAAVLAAMGPAAAGKGSGEQSLASRLYPRLEEDWLLIADRNFYNWQDWCAAADTGAALLWRVKADLRLPVLELLPDGSYRSVLVSPKIKGPARQKLIEAARRGEDLDEDQARHVRVVGVRGPRPRRGREGRADRPDHHHHRLPRGPGGRRWPRPTTRDGSTRPATPSSRPTCAAPGKYCDRSPRTWSSRRSGATS